MTRVRALYARAAGDALYRTSGLLVVNLIVDATYALLDPRIRYS